MKTNTKHFDYFVKECKKSLGEFGITGWDITYEQTKLGDVLAETSFRIPESVATIRLNTEWKYDKITQDDLKTTAWHEVCHFIHARLDGIGRTRFCSESELIEADEQAVNTIINFLRKIKYI